MKKKTLQKRKNHTPPRLSKRQRIIAGISGFVLIAACAVFLIFFIIRQTTTIIGFYDIPESYIASIETLAKDAPQLKTKFVVLSEKDVLSDRLSRKVDILVSRSGALTMDLSPKAMTIPSSIQSRFPTSINSSPFFTVPSSSGSAEFRVMPILLDSFESTYFKVLQKKAKQNYPQTLSQLESYAFACREFIPNPLICAGAQDDDLYGLISLLVEAYGGQKGYVEFVKQMKQVKAGKGIECLLSIPIGGDAPGGTTFAAVLNRIRQWQQQGLILPEWFKASEQTASVTMEDNHAAVIFMSLQEHRRKPFPAIKYFQGSQFPSETSKARSFVATSVCAMMFRGTESAQLVMNLLSSEAGQESLSVSTKLGPAALRGEAFDIQADDARYFAAALPGGPVPDIGLAAFKDKARRSAIATEIRTYLAQNQ